MDKYTYDYIISKHPELFIYKEEFPLKIITDKNDIEKWQNDRIQEYQEKGLPVNWLKIGVILNDPYIIMLRDLVEFPDDHLGGYFRIINRAELEGGRGVVILADMGKKILLIKIFRHSIRNWSWEFPRGFGESNTPIEENAKKELFEEVGGKANELIDLGIYHSNTGLEGNQVHLVYAKLEKIGKPNINEGIKETRFVNVNEIERMISNSEITDGFTIAAYTRAKLKKLI